MAQYGLSHYSKNITEVPPRKTVFENGISVNAKWQVPSGAYIKREFDVISKSHVLEFNTRGT